MDNKRSALTKPPRAEVKKFQYFLLSEVIKLLLTKDNIVRLCTLFQKLKGSGNLTIKIALLSMFNLFRKRINTQDVLVSFLIEHVHKITRSATDHYDLGILIL